MEEAGELAAREMPGRASRMRCAHGEGSPAYRAAHPRPGPAARARTGGREARLGQAPGGGHAGQTDWRDWGAGLPGDPAERARAAEVGLAEALRCRTSQKHQALALWPARRGASRARRPGRRARR